MCRRQALSSNWAPLVTSSEILMPDPGAAHRACGACFYGRCLKPITPKKHPQKRTVARAFPKDAGVRARASQPRMLHNRDLVLPRLHPTRPRRLSAAWPVMAACSGAQGKVRSAELSNLCGVVPKFIVRLAAASEPNLKVEEQHGCNKEVMTLIGARPKKHG